MASVSLRRRMWLGGGLEKGIVEVQIHSCCRDKQSLEIHVLTIDVDVRLESLILFWVHVQMYACGVAVVRFHCFKGFKVSGFQG